MLGLDVKAARATWTVLAILALVFLVYRLRGTLIVFVLAIFLAYLIAPVVAAIQNLLPGKRVSKTVSLALVYIALIALIAASLTLVGGEIVRQAGSLAGKTQEWMKTHSVLQDLPFPHWLEPMRDRITEFLRSQAEGVDSHLLPFITAAGTGILSGLGSVIYIVLIPVLAFFFMLEGADLLRSLVKLLPTEGERVMAAILADLHAMLGQYLRALLMLSFAVFVVYTAVFSLIGVPYGILCAGIAALLEFIPVVGWITGLTITLLVSGVAGYPHLLWIVGFLLVYRIFQDYVLQPHLFGSGVEVPPILVLFGVLAGEEIAGIPGMFFSVPVIATIRTIYLQLRKRRSERDAALNAPGPKT